MQVTSQTSVMEISIFLYMCQAWGNIIFKNKHRSVRVDLLQSSPSLNIYYLYYAFGLLTTICYSTLSSAVNWGLCDGWVSRSVLVHVWKDNGALHISITRCCSYQPYSFAVEKAVRLWRSSSFIIAMEISKYGVKHYFSPVEDEWVSVEQSGPSSTNPNKEGKLAPCGRSVRFYSFPVVAFRLIFRTFFPFVAFLVSVFHWRRQKNNSERDRIIEQGRMGLYWHGNTGYSRCRNFLYIMDHLGSH